MEEVQLDNLEDFSFSEDLEEETLSATVDPRNLLSQLPPQHAQAVLRVLALSPKNFNVFGPAEEVIIWAQFFTRTHSTLQLLLRVIWFSLSWLLFTVVYSSLCLIIPPVLSFWTDSNSVAIGFTIAGWIVTLFISTCIYAYKEQYKLGGESCVVTPFRTIRLYTILGRDDVSCMGGYVTTIEPYVSNNQR
jgi:hypothetical protein